LEKRGLLSPVDGKGYRKLHKRRAGGHCHWDYSRLSLEARHDTDPEAFIIVPDQVISKAAIAHLAFSEEKAEEIWYQWENWPAIDWADKMEEVFLDYILEHVEYSKDLLDDDDLSAWKQAMESWGIAEDLRDDILDPESDWVRSRNTCNEWIRESVFMSYVGLKSIRKASHDRAAGKPPVIPKTIVTDDGEIPLAEYVQRHGFFQLPGGFILGPPRG
jgi:hypothetical protein